MARCPFATWRGDVPNETSRGMVAHRGLVLHVQQGTEAGTDSWFHNPASQVSAHFGAAKDGSLDQWVDTDDKAWAEAAGNPSWVSVECEGYSGQSLTSAQVSTIGRLFAWLRGLYGFSGASVDDPAGSGLGWHGMGGAAWGGHLDCPGDPIKAQRPAILSAAGQATPTKGATVGVQSFPTPIHVEQAVVAFASGVFWEQAPGTVILGIDGSIDYWGVKDLGAPNRNEHGENFTYPQRQAQTFEILLDASGAPVGVRVLDTAGEHYDYLLPGASPASA